MKDLLEELKKEAKHINSKSFSPIGFDFRLRTKIERYLFLIAKKLCDSKFQYDLGGLTHTHQHLFFEYIEKKSFNDDFVQIIKDIFKLFNLITDISSSNPYAAEDSLEELGGTVNSMYKNVELRINKIINKIEELEK